MVQWLASSTSTLLFVSWGLTMCQYILPCATTKQTLVNNYLHISFLWLVTFVDPVVHLRWQAAKIT